jgi:hypothetical protein
MYLSCQNNNVLIKDSNDLWLIDEFKNNKYFVLKNEKDTFDYTAKGVKIIENIKEIEA